MKYHDFISKILFLIVFICVRWVFCVRHGAARVRSEKFHLTSKERNASEGRQKQEGRQSYDAVQSHEDRQIFRIPEKQEGRQRKSKGRQHYINVGHVGRQSSEDRQEHEGRQTSGGRQEHKGRQNYEDGQKFRIRKKQEGRQTSRGRQEHEGRQNYDNKWKHGGSQNHKVGQRHMGRRHHQYGQEHLNKSKFGTNTQMHGTFKLKDKTRHIKQDAKHLTSLTADKTDEILSIVDDKEFVDKVLELMKADDSDVLKDVNEDENPFFIKNSYSNAKRLNYSLNNIKRSNLHFLAFNSTIPDVRPNFPSIAFEPVLPQTESLNSSKPVHNASTPSHDNVPPSSELREIKASRVCKPGPPLASNKRLPNCLIIGDSIALSYSYSVAAALQGRCIVQLSSFSSMGVALDSSYALQCLPLLLSTSNLTPTRYDAIIFNFGLHDIDYSHKFPEEYNDIKKYKRNLGRLKKKFLRTGAGVAFVLTTPVTYDKEKNEMVKKYNAAAKRVMAKDPAVDIIDLYKYVIDKCGEPPFQNCFMMKKANDVHYGVDGSILLGKQVAAKFVKILKSRDLLVEKGFGLSENANLSLPLFDLKDGSTKCSINSTVPTRCPLTMTCIPNQISRTGFGCCPLRNGIDCGDNWHCCPQAMSCQKDCSFTGCKCLLT